jgi:hypothetical protein
VALVAFVFRLLGSELVRVLLASADGVLVRALDVFRHYECLLKVAKMSRQPEELIGRYLI